eukprot:Phypoly_transcript_13007.p1 GENE.Phypoly_transcript_13007~~Phypoly_transcript_13007.p1  ORF type:complete len:318 (-),score=34.48 Phypoly_transcript_13007:129-1082(-)
MERNHSHAFPIIFLFHGGGGTGLQAQNSYGMDTISNTYDVITVYPNGVDNTWNAGDQCCGQANARNISDIEFVNVMLDHIQSVMCIDSTRIYATGMSNGAVFSYDVACQISTRFAAVAIVEGTLDYSACNNTNPISLFHIHGDSDINIPYNGSYGCGKETFAWTSVPNAIARFLETDNCPCNFNRTMAGTSHCGSTQSTFSDGTVCTYFGRGSDNTNVTLCMVKNGGHSWSGSHKVGTARALAGCNATVGAFPATQEIWNFFSTQTLHSATSSTTAASSTATTGFTTRRTAASSATASTSGRTTRATLGGAANIGRN